MFSLSPSVFQFNWGATDKQNEQQPILEYGHLAKTIYDYLANDNVKNKDEMVKNVILAMIHTLGFKIENDTLTFIDKVSIDRQLVLLRDAMLAIQSLRFKYLFVLPIHTAFFSPDLVVDHPVTISSFTKNHHTYAELPADSKIIFIKIYDLLFSYLQNKLDCHWLFTYPKTIKHDADIAKWLNSFNKPSSHNVDFNRGYTLHNKVFFNGHDFDQYLARYVRRARGYTQENDKNLIMTWLKMYGGQETNSFMNLLTMAGHLTHEESYERIYDQNQNLIGPGPAINEAKNKLANWAINESGKLELDLQINVFSLMYHVEPKLGNVILINPLTQQTETLNQDQYIELLEELKAKAMKLDKPLVCFNIKLQLDIVDNQVQPVINDLLVLNYSEFIKSPACLDQALIKIKDNPIAQARLLA